LKRITPARHHWWPETLSSYWADDEGKVNWLRPDGETKRQPPNVFGAIRDGHTVRMSDAPGESSPWDDSFEKDFDQADTSFHRVLAWVNELDRCGPPFETSLPGRFLSTPVSQSHFNELLVCAFSLIVRSPRFRQIAGAYSIHHGVPGQERSVTRVMLANMRHSTDNLIKAFRGSGKAVAIFSPERELVFGDGFFTNVSPPAQRVLRPRAIVPLTSSLAVLIQKPSSYIVEPNLFTLVVNRQEADELNNVVQIYARDAIFYRSERPSITPEFARAEHLSFADDRNFADRLCYIVPGVRDEATPDWFYRLLDTP
jgi:hypothetical protein